jgi:hypothetical protein
MRDVAPVDRNEFSFRQWLESEEEGFAHCRLSDDISVSAVPVGSRAQDWVLRLSRAGTRIRDIQPSRASGIIADGWNSAPGPGVACDERTQRIFFGHPILGYVVAYNSDGRELWYQELPGFELPEWLSRSLKPTAEREVVDAATVRTDVSNSVMGRLSFSGDHLLAEYRGPPELAFRHAVFERNGRLIGVIGPWNGFFLSATDVGWRMHLGQGGGTRLSEASPFLPTGGDREDV